MENTVGSLTEEQKSLIIGKLLGDGSLRKKRNTLLEVNHSAKQKDYVLWFYKKFQTITPTPPKLRKSGTNRMSCRFTTRSMSCLNIYYDMFYHSGKKSISPELYLDALSLAVWFMDDGSKSRKSIYLNTQQFSDRDQLLLLQKLEELGVESTLNKDKSYFRIRVSNKGTLKLVELVKPFVIESMRYKLPL